MKILKILSLGGAGNVTKNMFVYEYLPDGRQIADIIVVDCGIGFPEEDMYGVDLIIPDISYLLAHKDKVRAIILTHGHEDHTGALSYVLPDLDVPVFATKLTAALAQTKLSEFGIARKIKTVDFHEVLEFGAFKINFVRVTHSVPDSANLLVETPLGRVYHGSDYKFDWTPFDGKPTEVGKIARFGDQGVLCLLSDCVRIEKEGRTLSELKVEETLESEIRRCAGKFFVTTQSSNISRLQQAINVSRRHNRKIVVLGRSLEENVDVTVRHDFLSLPPADRISDSEAGKWPDNKLSILTTGCQGQFNSALSRLARNENKNIKIRPGDTVVFSSDAIPGNESAVYTLIDEISFLGARVSYSDILEDLHVSGHGSRDDVSLMIGLSRPKHLWPIGGNFRHMRQFALLAGEMGYDPKQVLLPGQGQWVVFDESGRARLGDKVKLKNIMVDGLGVGDVEHVLLRDRKVMAEEGMVIILVPIDPQTGDLTGEIDVITRGFVTPRDRRELLSGTVSRVRQAVRGEKTPIFDRHALKRRIGVALEKFYYRVTRRRPLIVPVLIES